MIWDVGVVLDYLKTFDASSALSLKDISLKLTMLLFLLLASVDKLSISLTFTTCRTWVIGIEFLLMRS